MKKTNFRAESGKAEVKLLVGMPKILYSLIGKGSRRERISKAEWMRQAAFLKLEMDAKSSVEK